VQRCVIACDGDSSPIDLKGFARFFGQTISRPAQISLQSCPTRGKSLPVPTAMKTQKANWLKRILNAVCILYLILLAFSETYSALATAFDKSRRFPAWEAKLGWGMFVLPSFLIVGLVLLVVGKRLTLGFYLVALSLLLYLGFLFLDLALGPRIEHLDWVFAGIWTGLFALATAAAWFLRRRSTRP